jgi:cytochrome b involved in lipid metabolism
VVSVVHFVQRNNTDFEPAGSANEITFDDVRQHNQPDNCWLVVSSKVYGMTPYLAGHPTNTTYSTLCGTDATLQLIPDAPSEQSAKILEQIQPYYIGIITP